MSTATARTATVRRVGGRPRSSNQVKKLLEQSYSRVVVPQGGGRYAAEVLEFPGCIAAGASPAEAYTNLERAAEQWLARWLNEGREAPRPFTNQETSGRFALRLPKSLYVRASQAAARESVSLNLYIANAVAERVGVSNTLDGIVGELTKFGPRNTNMMASNMAGPERVNTESSPRPANSTRKRAVRAV